MNYVEIANAARAMVIEAGRLCTYVQYSQTATDPSKPWEGPTDARGTPVQSLSLPSVAVDVGTAQRLGIASISEDLLKRVSEFFIVAPGGSFRGDLLKCHEVVDGSARYTILNVAELRPGATTVIYYVAVER